MVLRCLGTAAPSTKTCAKFVSRFLVLILNKAKSQSSLPVGWGKKIVPRDSKHTRYKPEGFNTQKLSTNCLCSEMKAASTELRLHTQRADTYVIYKYTWNKFSYKNAENGIRVFIQPRSESEIKWRLFASLNESTVSHNIPSSSITITSLSYETEFVDVFKFHGSKIRPFLVLAGCFSTSPYKSLLSEQEVNLLGFKEVRLRCFTAVRLLPKVIPPFQFDNADTLEITQKKFIIHETGVASLSWNSIFCSKARVL